MHTGRVSGVNHPRWNHVLFDLDGTLVNTIDLIVASFQHAHQEVLAETVDRATISTWIGRTLPDIYSAWPDHTQQLWDCYVEFNLANLERLQTSFDHMTELVTELAESGVRIGVATSKARPAAERSLAAAQLDDRVELLATLTDTEHHKPHPAPLLHSLQKWDNPTGAVYVGDAVVDIHAARATGIDSVAVTWGAGDEGVLRAAQPTAVASTVDELRRVLLG